MSEITVYLRTNLGPPLPSTNSLIRFSTRTAFLDSLIDTLSDPPISFRHWKLAPITGVYVSYLIMYFADTSPVCSPSGELEPQTQSVLPCLKPKNRHYFEGHIRSTSREWFSDVRERRLFLERAVRVSLDGTPPLRNTTDPEFEIMAVPACLLVRAQLQPFKSAQAMLLRLQT